jgi:hypothetical protein
MDEFVTVATEYLPRKIEPPLKPPEQKKKEELLIERMLDESEKIAPPTIKEKEFKKVED